MAANNSNRGADYIDSKGQQLTVRSPGQLETIADIEQVVINIITTNNDNNTLIKVSDIAEVSIGKTLRTGAATRSGKEKCSVLP